MFTRFFEILSFVSLIIVINYYVINYSDNSSVGDRGDKGNDGTKGHTGSIGFKGKQGERGKIGLKGDDNINSNRGPKGKSGLRGDKGPQGDRGDRGEIGYKGNKGKQGDPGGNGSQGPPGDTGEKGDDQEDNYLKFYLEDGTDYEKEVQLDTDNSIYFDDYFIPLAGTSPSLNEIDSSFTVHSKGISNADYGGINNNFAWDRFVTGYKLKGNSITDDRARGYYTNIKIKNFGQI